MRKFIVTDPCYVLPKDTWHSVCDNVFSNKELVETRYERFDEEIQKELRKFAKTDLAWVGSTGIGDWSNSISSSDNEVANVIHSQFGADAGMVCICELTPSISKIIKDEGYSYDWCIALFEVDDTSIVEGVIDQSDVNWTVVNVKVNGDIVISSEEAESMMEDEDEDYYGYYENEEDE